MKKNSSSLLYKNKVPGPLLLNLFHGGHTKKNKNIVNNDYPITYMNFYRWFVEALTVSYVLYGSFCVHYIGYVDEFLDIYQVCYVIEILLKVPLFMFMRYGENQSDFFLNDIEASFV
ncbi:unnamed protein product, partial [Rotaria magnacalcarata]